MGWGVYVGWREQRRKKLRYRREGEARKPRQQNEGKCNPQRGVGASPPELGVQGRGDMKAFPTLG